MHGTESTDSALCNEQFMQGKMDISHVEGLSEGVLWFISAILFSYDSYFRCRVHSQARDCAKSFYDSLSAKP